jgi:hypothetical protein
VVASLFAGRSLAAAHYDVLFRATAGCARCRAASSSTASSTTPGFTSARWVRLIPRESFDAVLAER